MNMPAKLDREIAHYLLVNGLAGPESLSDYEQRGGYRALKTVIRDDDPNAVIASLAAAGLRGRGGAYFPTDRKWDMVRHAAPGTRYVVCNGGEHEPGSFKDRALMTHYPHVVLEGLLIAAHTIGATKAYVYVTEDQTEALTSIRDAIRRLDENGYTRVLSNHFDCELICVPGPSTYISGEETAVLNAIEGRDAKPRRKPPYPTVEGLFSAPTLINNAETLARVPAIIAHGPEWFREIGTPGSPGMTLITLTNGVNRPGVYEIPYGTTLHAIIEECGGGTLGGKAVKAILPGGPSLPFIDAAALATPFDHESLKQIGSGVGCGAIRIWLEDQCMVEPVLEIAEFFAEQQCGQCPPCRMETNTFVMALKQIASGSGSKNQILQMDKIASFARSKGGLCSLIPMAAAPILSALKLFETDFARHIEHGICTGVHAEDNSK